MNSKHGKLCAYSVSTNILSSHLNRASLDCLFCRSYVLNLMGFILHAPCQFVSCLNQWKPNFLKTAHLLAETLNKSWPQAHGSFSTSLGFLSELSQLTNN